MTAVFLVAVFPVDDLSLLAVFAAVLGDGFDFATCLTGDFTDVAVLRAGVDLVFVFALVMVFAALVFLVGDALRGGDFFGEALCAADFFAALVRSLAFDAATGFTVFFAVFFGAGCRPAGLLRFGFNSSVLLTTTSGGAT